MTVGLAACGSDGDSEEPAASPGTEEAAPEETEAAGDVSAFCEATVDAEAVIGMGPDVDFESATPEEIQEALVEFGAQVEPSLAEVEETAPEDVQEPVTTIVGLIRDALQSGDESAFEQPEFVESDAAIDEYMLAECGYEQIEATGTDYEYEGIPESVPAGVVAVTFANEGEEMHEIGIARINDDVTESLEELLQLPPEQSDSMVSFTGAAFAPPGESDTVFLRLEAGRYGAVCFVPEGTTHDTEGEGPPHFTLGMAAEFTAE